MILNNNKNMTRLAHCASVHYNIHRHFITLMQTTYILSYVTENVTNLPARRYTRTLQYVWTMQHGRGSLVEMTDNSPSFLFEYGLRRIT